MITVRMPDGARLRYKTAAFVRWRTGPSRAVLYTKNPDNGGKIVASIPTSSGALIEFVESDDEPTTAQE